ncbi:FAD-binding oxidoreductase [Povalibacter sp.]|uniref:NAD(P)/FAD-dependent oxidoreductase n=1 Tax=Povalibacter sp. TaxID=1962978 RepID=UPI002F40E2B1
MQTGIPGEQQVDPRTTDEWAWSDAHALPGVVDVAIIGGGIVGCSAAYFLAREGLRVALFEKGRIAGEQSGRNWGWVRQQGRSPVELPLMMRSLQLWLELREELGDIGFRQGGSLYLAQDEAHLAQLEGWLSVAREHGLDTQLLDSQKLGSVLRTDQRRWSGALHTASDARAEPSRAAPAIARAAHRRGAQIFGQCAVRGIDRGAGRIQGLITERGRVAASTVVCAGGAWTSSFCRSLGIDFPQLTVLGTVARTAPTREILEGEAWCPAIAIRRRADDGYTIAHGGSFLHSLTPGTLRYAPRFWPAFSQDHHSIRVRLGAAFFDALRIPSSWAMDQVSPFERQRMLHPEPEQQVLRQMRVALERWFPEIAPAAFLETWGGMIETSPDVLPVISHVDGHPGLLVASGFSGHGFGIGPGAGKLIADMVRGVADRSEVHAFRLQRFFDGSPIRPGPSI